MVGAVIEDVLIAQFEIGVLFIVVIIVLIMSPIQM